MSTPPTADYFDEWYTGLGGSTRVDELAARTLGLPLGFESTSLLSWAGIAEVVDALHLADGDVLVDLGCGRGGYGLEIARRTGAQLVGVDFASVAIERARQKSADARFVAGELTATGLEDGCAHAAMSIDAMQFAVPFAAGLAEALRILRPGSRLVLTGWQAHDLADEQVSPRLRYDIAAELEQAGFVAVDVRHMPEWLDVERTHWQAALALDPDDDPGVASLREEAEHVLPGIDRRSRVLATARKPLDS